MSNQTHSIEETPVKKKSSPFSGYKRDRNEAVPSSPVFDDLPAPPTISSSKLNFLKEPAFPKTSNAADKITSPAPKMIKRENTTPTKPLPVLLPCKLEDCSSDESESEDSQSPSSNNSSQGGGTTHQNTRPQIGAAATGGMQNAANFNAKNVPHLFSIPTQALPMRKFCYKCKLFGHVKQMCVSSWYHWWPSEYLFRYPWLRRRIREANQLRLRGWMLDYRKESMRIEKEVEKADRKKEHLFSQHRGNQNYNNNGGRYYGPNFGAQSRADGQKILHAIRRTNMKPRSPPACCPKQHQFSFDCHKLIDDLQKQVKQLHFQLYNKW